METQRKGIVLITFHNPAISDSTTTTSSSNNNGSNGGLQQEPQQQQNQQQQRKQKETQSDITGLPSMKFARKYMNSRKATPLRIAAYHLCTPDTPFYTMVRSFTTVMMGTEERCRMKVHVGTYYTLFLDLFLSLRVSIHVYIQYVNVLPNLSLTTIFVLFDFYTVLLDVFRPRRRKSLPTQWIWDTGRSVSHHRNRDDQNDIF